MEFLGGWFTAVVAACLNQTKRLWRLILFLNLNIKLQSTQKENEKSIAMANISSDYKQNTQIDKRVH